MSWEEEAACIESDYHIFYPDGTPSEKASLTKKAKGVCSTCTVRSECLEYSLVTEAYGTWGGLDEIEREVLRMERGMAVLLPARYHQKNSTLRALR